MAENQLKDYIVKLNDRNIQRQREKGLTIYALYGALIYCIFYLIEHIESGLNIFAGISAWSIATLTCNICFSLFYFYLATSISTFRIKETKIFKNRKWIELSFSDWPSLALLLILLTFNIGNFFLKSAHLHTYYLSTFTLLLLSNLLSPFAIIFILWRKGIKKKRKGDAVEEVDFTVGNPKSRESAILFGAVFGISLLVLNIIEILKFNVLIAGDKIADTVKYLIILLGLIHLCKLLIDLKKKDFDNNQLEDFEREIFFDNLTNDQIKIKFEEEFGHISFAKWMAEKNKMIDNFFQDVQKSINDTVSMLHALYDPDITDLTNEKTELLKNIIYYQKLPHQVQNFVQMNQNNLNNLRSFGSLNYQEYLELGFMQEYLNNCIKSFNISYHQLLDLLKEISPLS